MKSEHFSSDIQDFIRILSHHNIKYLIVGGEAVIYYGYARVTGDIDFFYSSAPMNVERLDAALLDFWSGSIPGIHSVSELAEKGVITQFGVPPNRIDLINHIDGITFSDAWERRVEEVVTIIFVIF